MGSRILALPVMARAGVMRAAVAAPALLLQYEEYGPPPDERMMVEWAMRHPALAILLGIALWLLILAAYIWMIVDSAKQYGCGTAIIVLIAGFFLFLPTFIIYVFVRVGSKPKAEYRERIREREPAYPGAGSSVAPGFPAQRAAPVPEVEPQDVTLSDAERDPQLDEIIATGDWHKAEAFAQEMMKTARGFKDDKGVARYAKYLARIRKGLR